MTAPRVAAPPDVEQAAHAHAGHGGEQTVVAPMPGTVLAVLVAAGDAVQPRQPLVVLEAMKMEHPVASPFEGVVKAVRVDPGDRVAGGAVLVELEGEALRDRAVGDPAGGQVHQPDDDHDTDVGPKPLMEKSGAIHSASPTIAMLMMR